MSSTYIGFQQQGFQAPKFVIGTLTVHKDFEGRVLWKVYEWSPGC